VALIAIIVGVGALSLLWGVSCGGKGIEGTICDGEIDLRWWSPQDRDFNMLSVPGWRIFTPERDTSNSRVPRTLIAWRPRFDSLGSRLTYLKVPLLWPLAVASVVTGLAWRRWVRTRRLASTGMCPACGHSRAGLAGGAVCPECGAAEKSLPSAGGYSERGGAGGAAAPLASRKIGGPP